MSRQHSLNTHKSDEVSTGNADNISLPHTVDPPSNELSQHDEVNSELNAASAHMEDTTALNEAARGSNTTVEDVNIATNSCDNKSANKADIKEDTVSGANKGSLKVTTHKLPVCPNVSCSPLIVDIKNKVTLLKCFSRQC